MNLNSLQLHRITFLSLSFSVVILIIRFYLADSFHYAFMVWNLFLAVIPYVISSWLLSTNWIRKEAFPLVLVLGIWLLFLPNAPYLITDLMHLHRTQTSLLWIDHFMLFAFAWNGLFIGIISMLQVFRILIDKWNLITAKRLLFIIVFLCGFGIYLGRFQRWNSWELFNNPFVLLYDCCRCLIHPEYRGQTWAITLGFGSFLWISFMTAHTLLPIKKASQK